MKAPKSQHGYTDIVSEMRTIDSLGPLARAAFNHSPRELSASEIVSSYKTGRRKLNLQDPEHDAAFANWLTREYEARAGHSLHDVLIPKRTLRASR